MRGHWSLVASALLRVDLPLPGWPLMRMMIGIGCLERDEKGITRIKVIQEELLEKTNMGTLY